MSPVEARSIIARRAATSRNGGRSSSTAHSGTAAICSALGPHSISSVTSKPALRRAAGRSRSVRCCLTTPARASRWCADPRAGIRRAATSASRHRRSRTQAMSARCRSGARRRRRRCRLRPGSGAPRPMKSVEVAEVVKRQRAVGEVELTSRQLDCIEVLALVGDPLIGRLAHGSGEHVLRQVDAEDRCRTSGGGPATEPAEAASQIDHAEPQHLRQHAAQRRPLGCPVEPVHRAGQSRVGLEELAVVVDVLGHERRRSPRVRQHPGGCAVART